MYFQVQFWSTNSDGLEYKTRSIEISENEDVIFIVGDIPSEIADELERQYDSNDDFYTGVTQNFEFEAERE